MEFGSVGKFLYCDALVRPKSHLIYRGGISTDLQDTKLPVETKQEKRLNCNGCPQRSSCRKLCPDISHRVNGYIGGISGGRGNKRVVLLGDLAEALEDTGWPGVLKGKLSFKLQKVGRC